MADMRSLYNRCGLRRPMPLQRPRGAAPALPREFLSQRASGRAVSLQAHARIMPLTGRAWVVRPLSLSLSLSAGLWRDGEMSKSCSCSRAGGRSHRCRRPLAMPSSGPEAKTLRGSHGVLRLVVWISSRCQMIETQWTSRLRSETRVRPTKSRRLSSCPLSVLQETPRQPRGGHRNLPRSLQRATWALPPGMHQSTAARRHGYTTTFRNAHPMARE